MLRIQAWLTAASLAALAAGGIGVGIHRSAPAHSATTSNYPGHTTTTTSPRTAPGAPASTAVRGAAGPSSGALASNLLVPNDLGVYYQVSPGLADGLIDSAPCLAGVLPSSAQSGRAATAMSGPNAEILEVVVSYPGSSAAQVFDSIASTLQACRSFQVSLEGSSVRVPMAPLELPTEGDQSAAWQGQIRLGGRTDNFAVGLSRSGQKVFLVAYVNVASSQVSGGLAPTLSAAIGKEA